MRVEPREALKPSEGILELDEYNLIELSKAAGWPTSLTNKSSAIKRR
jgi:hypothetical protein